MRPILASALAAVLTLAPVAQAATPSLYAAAVAHPGRPEKAVALDDSRKPAEVLAFLGLKPGMKVADLVTGSGYWAEIMGAVVGPKGSVTGFEPSQFWDADEQKIWDGISTREPTVRFVQYPFEAFAAAPHAFDFAIINLNYHDLYWTSEKYHIPHTDPAAYLRTLYAAMKPGGIVGVIDHVGPSGDTRAIVDKVHRIDPETVKADFAAAGFKLVGSSDMLRNPADDHSKGVFDKSIRGHTDRFLFRFRKP